MCDAGMLLLLYGSICTHKGVEVVLMDVIANPKKLKLIQMLS